MAKVGFFEWVVGVSIPAFLVVAGVVLSQQFAMTHAQGVLSSRFDTFDLKLDKVVDQVGTSITGFRNDLELVKQHVEATQIDASSILVGMGVVQPDSVYKSVAYDGAIWLIPSPDLRVMMEAKGGKFERISEKAEVYGFKVIPVSAIGNSQNP